MIVTCDSRYKGTVVDLAQPWHRGMPVSPNHPGFEMSLMRRHGDYVRPDGGSASNEVIVMGGHVGTHLDALAHVSHNGLLHGGVVAADITSNMGFSEMGVDTVDPIVCRGVLLDVAGMKGVNVLDPAYEITAEDLERTEEVAGISVMPGDAVLIRSGWDEYWNDPERFRGQIDGAPGPGEKAAAWLSEREIRIAGAETIAFEVVEPGAGHSLLPVHRVLLVERGIHIIEVMNLRRLASLVSGSFTFVASPLNIVGATGSPVRPIAILDG